MELNQIIYEDNYQQAFDYISKNKLAIIEIDADDKGRRFKIVDPSTTIPQEYKNINEIEKLKNWYDTYYTQHEQKYRRLHSLGKLTDEGKDPYNELINLYNEAEIKRARIQELERLLSDSSK